MSRRVVILSGVSGSGKSTRVRELLEGARGDSCVVSADAFFVGADGVYRYDAAKQGEAHRVCEDAFLEALRSGVELVIVDNTATRFFEVARYAVAARLLGYAVEVVTIETMPRDLMLVARRNAHGVPLSVIEAQAKRLRERGRLPVSWNERRVPMVRA